MIKRLLATQLSMRHYCLTQSKVLTNQTREILTKEIIRIISTILVSFRFEDLLSDWFSVFSSIQNQNLVAMIGKINQVYFVGYI